MSTDGGDNLRTVENMKVLEQELRAKIAEQETKLIWIVERVARVRHDICRAPARAIRSTIHISFVSGSAIFGAQFLF